MRGAERKQASMLCLMSPETVVRSSHPLRKVKKLADAALKNLSAVFDEMYAEGRPAFDPAGASAESDAADGVLHGPK